MVSHQKEQNGDFWLWFEAPQGNYRRSPAIRNGLRDTGDAVADGSMLQRCLCGSMAQQEETSVPHGLHYNSTMQSTVSSEVPLRGCFPTHHEDAAKSPAGRTHPSCNKAAPSAAGWSRPKRDCQLN